MKIDELESLLHSPETKDTTKNTTKTNNSTLNFDLFVASSLVSGETNSRQSSPVMYCDEINSNEKDLILNDLINFCNGMVGKRASLHYIKSTIYAFLGSYVYRWYPHLRSPNIHVSVEFSQSSLAYEVSISLDKNYIGKIGISI